MGFPVGLVIGGILTDSIGWRPAFYLFAGNQCSSVLRGRFCLPKSADSIGGSILQRLKRDIDWVGVLLISTSLGLLSYVLAAITAKTSDVSKPENIAFLTLAVVLVPTFVLWVYYQENSGRRALIPNSI